MLRIELIFVVFSHDIGVARLNKSCSGYAALTLPTLLLSSPLLHPRHAFFLTILSWLFLRQRRVERERREEQSRGLEGDRRGGRTKERGGGLPTLSDDQTLRQR